MPILCSPLQSSLLAFFPSLHIPSCLLYHTPYAPHVPCLSISQYLTWRGVTSSPPPLTFFYHLHIFFYWRKVSHGLLLVFIILYFYPSLSLHVLYGILKACIESPPPRFNPSKPFPVTQAPAPLIYLLVQTRAIDSSRLCQKTDSYNLTHRRLFCFQEVVWRTA